jgi:YNFM family putative membrane transporter
MTPASTSPLAAIQSVAPGQSPGFRHGTRPYRRASLALFLAGFATFSLLYCVQPLLPEFTHDYRIAPGISALALSLTTGALALTIFLSGAIAQMLPRRG